MNLRALEQTEEETITEFADPVQKMVMVGFEDSNEHVWNRLAVDTFLSGCIDVEAKKIVLTQNPPNLDKALKAMKQVIASHRIADRKTTNSRPKKPKSADYSVKQTGCQESAPESLFAPISDNLLLGLDFLKEQKATINLDKVCLELGETVIPAQIKSLKNGVPSVSRVTISKRERILPHSAKVVKVKLAGIPDASEQNFAIEAFEDSKVTLTDILVKNTPQISVLICNTSNKILKLIQNDAVAVATEIDTIINPEGDPLAVQQTQLDEPSSDHLVDWQ